VGGRVAGTAVALVAGRFPVTALAAKRSGLLRRPSRDDASLSPSALPRDARRGGRTRSSRLSAKGRLAAPLVPTWMRRDARVDAPATDVTVPTIAAARGERGDAHADPDDGGPRRQDEIDNDRTPCLGPTTVTAGSSAEALEQPAQIAFQVVARW